MLPAGTAVTCVGDVSKLEDAKRMVDATVAFGGKIDILVNNAAIDPGGSVVDLDPDVWHAVIETNLTGPFYTMKCAIPHMIENGGGAIINISSLASVRCIPTMAPYCASKAGLNHLTNQVALDFGKHGIRAVSVLPGPVRTEMSEHSLGGMADAMGCDMDGVFKQAHLHAPAGAGVASAGDRRARAPSWAATTPASSPPRPSWWMAAPRWSTRAARRSR